MSDLKKFAPILSEDETIPVQNNKSASSEHFRNDLIENILKTTGLSRENAILTIGGI
jgi:hypothetical protein